MVLKCGYWNIRGLMQPVRLLLEYLEIPYDEKRYDCKACDDGSWNRSEWTDEKFQLGLEFPNLPWMIDEETGIKLVQSDAILRYICHKYNPELLGKSLADNARVDMLCGVIGDMKGQCVRTAYGKDYDKNLELLRESIKAFIPQLTAFMKGPFAVGHYISYIDFVVYENIDVMRLMCPEEFNVSEAKPLLDYLKRIEELPQISSYMKSDKFISRPVNNKMAAFK